MRQAFLVSDDDIKSLKIEPWLIELNGPAIFMHENVIKLLQAQSMEKLNNVKSTIVPIAGEEDRVCPECGSSFANLAGRNIHRKFAHGVKGLYANRKTAKARRLALQNAQSQPQAQLPPPSNMKPTAFICNICQRPSPNQRGLTFHRWKVHGIKSASYDRNLKTRMNRENGRKSKPGPRPGSKRKKLMRNGGVR